MCICTRIFKTFLSNRFGYTYSIWGTPPICLKPLAELFLQINTVIYTFQSLWISTLHPWMYQGYLGDSAKHSSLHKSRSCLCCPASLRPLRAPMEPRRNLHLQKTWVKNILELKKAVKGLQKWPTPGNKSTAKTSQRLFKYVYWSSKILNLLV